IRSQAQCVMFSKIILYALVVCGGKKSQVILL
ncbi:MAG: hypothetical protein ACI90V_010518, partial [Bacillariaceae sp.]